jgi:hypothetical protein
MEGFFGTSNGAGGDTKFGLTGATVSRRIQHYGSERARSRTITASNAGK